MAGICRRTSMSSARLAQEVRQTLEPALAPAREHLAHRRPGAGDAAAGRRAAAGAARRPRPAARRSEPPPARRPGSASNIRGTSRGRKRRSRIRPSAAATWSRPSDAASRVSPASRWSASSAAATSSSRELPGQGEGGDRRHARVAVREVGAHELGAPLAADRRQGVDRRRPHLDAAVPEEPLDGRAPVLPQLGPGRFEGEQGAHADPLRRVVEEERGHEVPLVEGLEQVDRVEDALLVGVRQLLDEGFDRREIGLLRPHRVRLDHPRLDAAAERAPGTPAARARR